MKMSDIKCDETLVDFVSCAVKNHEKLVSSLASILSIHDGECRFVRGCCQEHLDLTGDGKCHVGDAKRLLKELGHEI